MFGLRSLLLTISGRYGLPALAGGLIVLIVLNYLGIVDNQTVMEVCSYTFGASS